MKPRDLIDLLLLAALWGASFLFMRMAAPSFGPIALVEVRVSVAALMLLPLLAWQNGMRELRSRVGPIVLIGLLNSAIPFALLSYGTLHLTAGFASILNATTPMWTALVAWLWFHDKIRTWQSLGLVVGLVGVVVLVWGKADIRPGSSGFATFLAIGACLLATLSYGVSANLIKRRLTGVAPLTIATGSQCAAALALAPLAFYSWPAHPPGLRSWIAALLLGVMCTALAYILYFRLLARIGPMGAASVTFLIPLFATLWGAMLLHEGLTAQMAAGGTVILVGTVLVLGLVGGKRRQVS